MNPTGSLSPLSPARMPENAGDSIAAESHRDNPGVLFARMALASYRGAGEGAAAAKRLTERAATSGVAEWHTDQARLARLVGVAEPHRPSKEQERTSNMLPAEDAAALCNLLEQQGVRFWLMGGWGVDALLHRQTRPHKDLDALVLLDDLPALWNLLDAQGFTLRHVWEENRWLEEEPHRWPTAFVVADRDGRELDIHVISIEPNGVIVQRYDNPWPFPDDITGQGSIAGVTITCVSRETQLAMHTGYTLPDSQRRDLDLLQTD